MSPEPPDAEGFAPFLGRASAAGRRVVRASRSRLIQRRHGPTDPPPMTTDATDGAPSRFDAAWYLAENPDVEATTVDPWQHFLAHGRFEGRSPHPLFDTNWYARHYRIDPSDGGPFLDWASRSADDRRSPNEFFDVDWYLQRSPEIAAHGQDPVEHYRVDGWRQGRRPGPLFDPTWYLGTYDDVRRSGIEPLTHYLHYGRGEGRHANHLEQVASTGLYRPPDQLIPWFSPVNFAVRPPLAQYPRVNVLLPGMGVRHLTGGPNTAIQFGYRLAALGHAVRFIATDAPLDDDLGPLWAHMERISGVGRRLWNVEVVDGSNRYRPVEIGENDLFLATAWWTAQSVKAALPLVRQQRFLYLIQDFEPLFFASSSQYALALETYGLDHVPIVNSRYVLDHLVEQRVGRFADPQFVESAIVFEPTVDRSVFHPQVPRAGGDKRRLLFYARPQNGLRNLFELGVAAIQAAVARGVLEESEWDFLGMGEQFEPVAVGPRSVLRPLPWKDFDGYAEQMRSSDILVSLMLAPHASYPPLEMAACGGLAVTTEFGPKSRAALKEISPNIIGAEATIEALADAIAEAVERLTDLDGRILGSTLALPDSWDEVFDAVLPLVSERLTDLERTSGGRPSPPGTAGSNRYERWQAQRITDRVTEYPLPELRDPLTFSLMTAVWNTSPTYLRALAESVMAQDLPTSWEWVITDNGSTDPATIEILAEIGRDPRVVIVHQEANLGILGGMRSCLEHASGCYVLHVDHDDLLTADALRVIASSLAAAGWPEAFYSDEDKVRGTHYLEPYLKPDWDPVLFSNSCYIAHLCGVDRQRALALDAYLDPRTEASPDWDLFTRLTNAGVTPHHVPEVLYSWRIHAESTAGNPTAKPYALATHERVLTRLLESHHLSDRFSVAIHPDSPDQLDWFIDRLHVEPRPVTTLVLGDEPTEFSPIAGVDHRIASVALDDHAQLSRLVAEAATGGRLIHLLNSTAEIRRSKWYWEALGIFELYPDTAMVAGPTLLGTQIHEAGVVFGFGDGWGSPARGEPSTSRGWFAQNLKQHSVDGASGDHVVVDAAFLDYTLASMPDDVEVSTIAAWCSIHAARSSRRVVYSPLLRAAVTEPAEHRWSHRARASIIAAAAAEASGRNRSRFLSLDDARPNRETTTKQRATHLRAVESIARRRSGDHAYHAWLLERIQARTAHLVMGDEWPTVSIITPVYAGTDPALFAELADCLAAQTSPIHEWVIGLDGEITPELDAVIADRRAADPRLRVVGGRKGGILATMRTCLHACSGDYFIPVDADDLMTVDAVALLCSTAESTGRPDLVHSDEDVLDGDTFRDPFIRPNWDPVLHLSGSYVWHALLIKRSTALELDVYGDPAFEWCHDWDTVERIRRANGTIVHLPEVVYHWRRHAGSSTHTDLPESAQADSVKSMFLRFAADTGHPERYSVEEFPLWRGAPEFHLRRRPIDAPPVALLSLGELSEATRSSLARSGSFPFSSVVDGPAYSAPLGDLRSALEALEETLVTLVDGVSIIGGSSPVWEAIKWFELCEVGAVSGRSVTPDGRVWYETAAHCAESQSAWLPAPGYLDVTDPGPYALALKPRSITTAGPAFLVADRSKLLRVLETLDGEDPTPIARGLATLGSALPAHSWRIIQDPLIEVLAAERRT